MPTAAKSVKDLTTVVDEINNRFIDRTRRRLTGRLAALPLDGLETIVSQHCRFSAKNPEFLAKAARIVAPIDADIERELLENYEAEKTHGALYRAGLLQLGVDVEARPEAPETSEFFVRMAAPIRIDDVPLSLGAIYGSEGVSVFEHEIFKVVCAEIARRKGIAFAGSAMERFYDMHLEGLEQAHKQDLAHCVDRLSLSEAEQARLLEGACVTLEAMTGWWTAMLDRHDPETRGAPAPLTDQIDEINCRFTSATRARLMAQIGRMPEAALEWLVCEHFQFSNINTRFLDMAAETARGLADPGVRAELVRNFNEESGHAVMYRGGLAKIGTDVETRQEFAPTTRFFAGVADLITGRPAVMAGAVYATETAAIFEHEVFWEVCKALTEMRGMAYSGSVLQRFHDMHLEGVEQSHKDELGQFLEGIGEPAQVTSGALLAIKDMETWWTALLDRVDQMIPSAHPALLDEPA